MTQEKLTGLRLHAALERLRGRYPRRRIVRQRGEYDVLDCGHQVRHQPPHYDLWTATTKARVRAACVECARARA